MQSGWNGLIRSHFHAPPQEQWCNYSVQLLLGKKKILLQDGQNVACQSFQWSTHTHTHTAQPSQETSRRMGQLANGKVKDKFSHRQTCFRHCRALFLFHSFFQHEEIYELISNHIFQDDKGSIFFRISLCKSLSPTDAVSRLFT